MTVHREASPEGWWIGVKDVQFSRFARPERLVFFVAVKQVILDRAFFKGMLDGETESHEAHA